MQIFLAGEYYRNMGNAVKQIVWGGIVPEVNHETVSGKPSHVAKIQTGDRISNANIEGGIPNNNQVSNENIHGRHSTLWGG